jgi:hypothetical protein
MTSRPGILALAIIDLLMLPPKTDISSERDVI